MTPAVIFGSINLAQSIAGYMGLIESVGGNVQKLLHAPFKSAVNNLNAALSSNAANTDFYIRQALVEFNQACSLEENENLISSFIGKAMCQHLLGDTVNRDITMSKIKNVELTLSEKTKSASKTALKYSGFGNMYRLYKLLKGENPYTNDYALRLKKFEEYKQLALATK
jgi:hypothetical protein